MSQTAAHNNAQSAPCHTQQNAGLSPASSGKEGGAYTRGEISPSGNSQSLGNGFRAGEYSPRESKISKGGGGFAPVPTGFDAQHVAALEMAAAAGPVGMCEVPLTAKERLSAALSGPTAALLKRGVDIDPESLSAATRAAVADAVPILAEISQDADAGTRARIQAVDSLVGIMTATAPKQTAAQVGIVIQGAPQTTPQDDLAAFEAAFERVD